MSVEEKQQLIRDLSISADFEACRGGKTLKVQIRILDVGKKVDMFEKHHIDCYLYILESDTLKKLKDEICKNICKGEKREMVLREGSREGIIINPIEVASPGFPGRIRVLTGDGEKTMLSIGFNKKYLSFELTFLDK